MQAGFSAGSEADTFTVTPDGDALPKYSVSRTGARELTVTFPGGRPPTAPGIAGSKLVAGVRPTANGFKILLKTDAFGYVAAPAKGGRQLRVQVFADAIGATWADAHKAKATPAERRQKADDAKAKRDQARQKREEQAKQQREAKSRTAEEAAKRAAETKRGETVKRQPTPAQPAPAPIQQARGGATRPSPPAQNSRSGKPFYSVPYSLRAPVNKSVIGPGSSTTTLPPVEGHAAAPVPTAHAAAPAATAVAAPVKTPPPAAAPTGRPVGVKLPPGVTERPILQEHTANIAPQGPTSAPEPSAKSIARTASKPPTDVNLPKGRTQVLFRAEHHGPEDLRPAQVLSGAPAAPRPAAAPSQAQPLRPGQPATAQPLPNKPWSVRQTVQKVYAPTGSNGNATLPQVGGAATAAAKAAAKESQQGPQPGGEHGAGNTSEHAPAEPHPAANATHAQAAPPAQEPAPAAHDAAPAGGAHGSGDKKEKQGPLSLKEILAQVTAAQTDMVAGKWNDAVTKLEALLHEPALKGPPREDVLYALGDAYMQAYRDKLAANFDKIAGAQLAAMNANPKSRHVPHAMVNLGLLNLRVGNLPEARAYFNIVRKKYPQDDSAPIIPYSLGEYYRGKGDLKTAAAQYQDLIQNYPDSRMAKETAFNLVQVLRELGAYDKAYQIADYLDKRWPLFYMDNPDFLRIHAEVEEKNGKLDQAKDHYWTYYNLLPKSQYADVTLVRIGDIYLRQNKRTAALEIYQKALQDFPNREGGQVAQMRIAEEGIYDDPTMKEMEPIFDRPSAIKPNEAYTYIYTKFPQSPLAPLALIKLGMWQFHNKSYMDAMNTVNTFLQKYPQSKLIDKANELGFQAFLMALPNLVQDGNYARVMQIYDGAPYVKSNWNNFNDGAQMAIAVSAWKLGQPDRALKLAGRFLGKRQVPKYSEMALDLAMNIFMEGKQWKRIADLATRANRAWKLSPRQKTAFENAKAMALENSGDSKNSLPLWTRIAANAKSDPGLRAHATYMLAKDAARRNDMFRLFALSQEALTQLLATHGDKAKIKDCMLMAITATERSGQFAQALRWGNAFDAIIPPSDPDWAPVRLRLAEIYRRGNQLDEWKKVLAEVVKKQPKTIYARMAQQSLDSNALDQRLQNYLVQPPKPGQQLQ